MSIPGYTALRGLAVDRAGALVEVTEDASGRLFVVRVLSPALTSDARFMHQLRRDVAILRPLRHPNLVPVWAYDDRAKAVLYDAVAGATLSELLGSGTAMDAAAAFLVFDDCLAGLAELHRVHVPHRDVHPDAVVVDRTGVARLRDAGVPAPPLHAGWRAGTPSYMAPELWAGQSHTPSSDIYAAACVFVEALTGHRAFPSAELASLRAQHERGQASISDLSAPAHRLAAAGLAVDARERPDASIYRANLAVVAAATVDQGWRDRGRVWLTDAVKRSMDAPPPVAAALPPAISDEDFAEMSPKRPSPTRWRRGRLWAAIAAAVVALAVVSVVAVAALTGPGHTIGTDTSPVAGASASPSSSDSAPSDSASASGTPSDVATPTDASTPAASPSTAAQITPSTEQPSLGPATSATPTSRPTATPTPTPTPTPTICLIICHTP